MLLASLRANMLACVLGLAAAILLVISVKQSVELDGFLWVEGVRDKLERVTIDNNELRGELKRISTLKNEQADRTKVIIREVVKRVKVADKEAERIEKAPLPGNCTTPPEIMGADL